MLLGSGSVRHNSRNSQCLPPKLFRLSTMNTGSILFGQCAKDKHLVDFSGRASVRDVGAYNPQAQRNASKTCWPGGWPSVRGDGPKMK
jgi:hypothetical protein